MPHSRWPHPPFTLCQVKLFSYIFDVVTGNTVNLGPQAVTTNVEQFQQEFIDCYTEGFLLNQFVKVPGIKSTTRSQNWGDRQPYQAIFSKPVHQKSVHDVF